MIPNSEVFQKAKNAVLNYREVYGCFPEKIGIHWRRFKNFQPASISFPELLTEVSTYLTLDALDPPSFKIHRVPFEPVAGDMLNPDEVYFLNPHDQNQVISGYRLSIQAEIHKHASL